MLSFPLKTDNGATKQFSVLISFKAADRIAIFRPNTDCAELSTSCLGWVNSEVRSVQLESCFAREMEHNRPGAGALSDHFGMGAIQQLPDQFLNIFPSAPPQRELVRRPPLLFVWAVYFICEIGIIQQLRDLREGRGGAYMITQSFYNSAKFIWAWNPVCLFASFFSSHYRNPCGSIIKLLLDLNYLFNFRGKELWFLPFGFWPLAHPLLK